MRNIYLIFIAHYCVINKAYRIYPGVNGRAVVEKWSYLERSMIEKLKSQINLAQDCFSTDQGQNFCGFLLLKPPASAMGEADHSGAGDIYFVFSSFCKQQHVQDFLFVGQGKAG